jgi:glycosyltransferase involved in cell wall biosynthesis
MIVGDGRERALLEALARELGIYPDIIWTGMLREQALVERIAACDVFASASATETQGLVFLEAMAMGLPAVGVRAGGVPEYVRHQVNGIIAEPNDPDSLAAALTALVAASELRARYGAQARRDVRAYDAGEIVTRIEDIYLRL